MAGRARQRTPPQPAPGHGVTEHAAPGRKRRVRQDSRGSRGRQPLRLGSGAGGPRKKFPGQAPPPPETPAAGAGGTQAAQAARRGAEGRRRRAGGGGRVGEGGYVPQCVNLSSIVSPWRGRRKAPPEGGAPARLVRVALNVAFLGFRVPGYQRFVQAAGDFPGLAEDVGVGSHPLQQLRRVA